MSRGRQGDGRKCIRWKILASAVLFMSYLCLLWFHCVELWSFIVYIGLCSFWHALHTHIFCWATFSFEHGIHSSWHNFRELMQCLNIHFHSRLQSFPTKILHCIDDKVLLWHVPDILNGVTVWTLWLTIHVWKSYLIVPETFSNLGLHCNGQPKHPQTWWLQNFIHCSSYPDAPITLEQGNYGLIQSTWPFLSLLQSPIFMLPGILKPH